MQLQGHFQNGVVVLDGGTAPPDGTTVTVSINTPQPTRVAESLKPIPFPPIRAGQPGTTLLTNAMLAEILDNEGASPGH
jgi:hypothetical protein